MYLEKSTVCFWKDSKLHCPFLGLCIGTLYALKENLFRATQNAFYIKVYFSLWFSPLLQTENKAHICAPYAAGTIQWTANILILCLSVCLSVLYATQWHCISSQNILFNISGNNVTEYKRRITSATSICTVETREEEVGALKWDFSIGAEWHFEGTAPS
jgi:hypothetical protein